MAYCVVHNNKVVAGPMERPSTWAGVKNFNYLSDEDLLQYGWYKAEEINSYVDPRWQKLVSTTFTVNQNTVTVNNIIEEIPRSVVLKTKLKELADFRYNYETSGLEVGGSIIRSDRESQAQITGAYNAAKNGLFTTMQFKAATGWVTLDAATMITIGEAMYTHVQWCFVRESQLSDIISNLQTSKEIAEFEIQENW